LPYSKNAYREPLGVISLAHGEDGLHRPVGGQHKASGVHEELAGNVEEDEEEVEGGEAEDDIDLGDGGLLLELLELRVLGQLPGLVISAAHVPKSIPVHILIEIGEVVLRSGYLGQYRSSWRGG
jgi:hypothetical protein